MEEQDSGWNWEIPGFEGRKSFEREDHKPPVVMGRSSISALPQPEVSRHVLSVKVQRLRDQIKLAREDYFHLRQEASDLQEYSRFNLESVMRYLGVLADRARKLDQTAYETEARMSPLISEKKKLFNDLVTAKGSIKIFCHVRPLLDDESQSVVEIPDDFTIRINTGVDAANDPTNDFEFDRVYGPDIGEGELFHDVQPFIQSAFEGNNVSLFAFGQTHSGKTDMMEGSSNDRGLYMRSFEELYDLSNMDTSTSEYNFYVTAVQLYDDQIQDLLSDFSSNMPKVHNATPESFMEVVQVKVCNPLDFSRVLQVGLKSRGEVTSRCSISHLIITIHIHNINWVAQENFHSKLSLVELAGSDGLLDENASDEHAKESLYSTKSLHTLRDVLSSLNSKKPNVSYENSSLTSILADSLGGSSKTLMIVTVCPNVSNLSGVLSTLNFAVRARNIKTSLGSQDTINKWRDKANDYRQELHDLKQEIQGLKQELNDSGDQCVLLFNEVQKAWKVSFTLQEELKSENVELSEQLQIEKEQNSELQNQIVNLLQVEQERKMQVQQRDSTIQSLQAKVDSMKSTNNESTHSSKARSNCSSEEPSGDLSSSESAGTNIDRSEAAKKLEEELSKRDALIKRLHQENEKLFDRLTDRTFQDRSLKLCDLSPGRLNIQSLDQGRGKSSKEYSADVLHLASENDNIGALVKSGSEKVKSTPAGEYLTAALMDFDPELYDSPITISDGANKLLMLVLAAVIKAGAAREHEILDEIRDAAFSFIRRMEQRRVMDTMLVARVRILYIRSLLARSPVLQFIKVSPVQRFLEKVHSGGNRSSSRSNSPGWSPLRFDPISLNTPVDEHVDGFKVNIKPEKKSKFSSLVLKLRGIDQETWRQHVTGGKLREITEEAKNFATGNKSLAALFVHTPAGELQRHIKSWLTENFEFLSVSSSDALGGATGQLELLSTAIMDGWMAGLGAAPFPTTDALGQLLSEYTKRVYTSQLQHLKDIAGTLAIEEAEDLSAANKLRSALDSVDNKRKKIWQQMQSDIALLTKEEGGSPINNPSTTVEEARKASLVSLDGILKQLKDIRQASQDLLTKSKKKALLASLDELSERMSSLLEIDHPCAQRHITDARNVIDSMPEQEEVLQAGGLSPQLSANWLQGVDTDVAQWNVLQFNTGSTAPFIVKCGANSKSELVVKAAARVQDFDGGEIVTVAPRPSVLTDMSLEELKLLFAGLPEALSLLAIARTADGTRARYSRLYRTLAMKVPVLKDLVAELDKGGLLNDVRH